MVGGKHWRQSVHELGNVRQKQKDPVDEILTGIINIANDINLVGRATDIVGPSLEESWNNTFVVVLDTLVPFVLVKTFLHLITTLCKEVAITSQHEIST